MTVLGVFGRRPPRLKCPIESHFNHSLAVGGLAF